MTRRTTRAARRKPAGRYHHGDLRGALVDAALRLVEQEGAHALTLRELARRLGVSHAAPAHHFADKSALLVALATEGFGRFARALEEAAAGAGGPRERLRRLGHAYVRFALDHPGYFRVMFGPHVAAIERCPEALEAASAAAYRVLERCAEDLVREQGRDAAEAPRVAFAAWSLVHGMATLYLDGPLRFHLPPGDARQPFLAMVDAALKLDGRLGRDAGAA